MAEVELQGSGQITELQSLRGIAAATVMIGHCLISYGPSALLIGLSEVLNGQAAVAVFFVLSGYVLTCSLQRGRFDRDAVLGFYVRRGFRLYPAIWVASAFGLAYLFALHWQIPPDRAGPLIQQSFRPDRFDTLHIVTSFAGMTTFIIPQLWTIFIEIVASIAMPGIAFVALYRRQWFPCILGVALLVSLTIPNTYYHVTLYLIDFVVGAGLAIPGLAMRLFHYTCCTSLCSARSSSSSPFAWLSYVYVEEPGIKLGKRVLEFLGRPRGLGPGMTGTAVP